MKRFLFSICLFIAIILSTGCDNKATYNGQEINDVLTVVDVSNNIYAAKKEQGKVNIYFFYGDGCPRCAEEEAFFKEIKEKYGQYYNLYTFEVWYNEDNAELIKVFADSMGDTLTGVPYTIIGEKSITGFNEAREELLLSAILEQKDKDYDVYIDKIKEKS